MNTIEKQNFLKTFRDLLEFRDGFDNGMGAAYAEYKSRIEELNRHFEETKEYTEVEVVKPFNEFFMDYIRPVYRELDNWLAILPAETQKFEVKSLLGQVAYYVGLADKFKISQYEIQTENGKKVQSKSSQLLNEIHPVIKQSLQIISERLKKYLPDEEETLMVKHDSEILKLNFAIQKIELAVLFLGLKDCGIISQSVTEYQLAKFLETHTHFKNNNEVKDMAILFTKIAKSEVNVEEHLNAIKNKFASFNLPKR